ncbi:hypothetical protein IH601_06370, partial [Candidatus Bipolaricaulota bacterium]|nr:hypothetical protein [Candidatus Bipolaricaulota bacterium]
MNKRIWYLSLLMMVIGIALVACSSNNNEDTVNAGDSGPVASVEDSTPAVDAQQPADTPALASVEQPDVSEPSPSLEIEVDVDTGVDVGVTLPPAGIFAGASAALEALDSYRFTTSFLFSGQEDGEIESGSIELSGEIMDAQRKHFVWKNLEDNEQFEIIQLEDEAWVYDE